MTQNNKILLGVGAFIVGGLGLYLIFKPNRRDNVYNPANIIDEEIPLSNDSRVVDSLITTTGNLLPEIFAQTNAPGCQAATIQDPYSIPDQVQKANYQLQNSNGNWLPSEEVKKMQTWLSNQNADIKGVIDNSGGIDGYIGPGFKTAYNMARKTCLFQNPVDLELKSGASKII